MSELASLAAGLDGSPYSLPDDPSQRELVEEALRRGADLENRCLVVRQELAGSSEKLRRATRTTEIFESNAIEGKTVTLLETKAILERQNMWDAEQALATYTLHRAFQGESNVQDVVGLAGARILVDEYIADRSRTLTEVDLREFHGLILSGDVSAGRYKEYINRIQGSEHTTVPPVDVPSAMHGLVSWMREAKIPLFWKSAASHAWLTHIHPFDDGNGRIARLLANYVLGKGSYPPLIVKSTSDRPRYINALGHSDAAGDISSLARLFVRVLDREMKLMERPDFAWSLFQADLLMREQSVYRRWYSTVRRFFDEVTARLVLAKDSLEIVGQVSPSDYRQLCNRDSGGNAWFAKVSTSGKVADLLIWIGYTTDRMQRHLELDQFFPSFFISEKDPDPRAVRPYRQIVTNPEPFFDELCIIADENRVLFRRGHAARIVSLSAGAELFSELLSSYMKQAYF